ncbi:NPCBM/NEW2 domain-containing protein [Streptomyces luridiscabiei]
MSQDENGRGEGLPARRQAREDRDRIKAAFGTRLRVLLDLTGLSSREFAARFPAYKDSTVRKYTLGTNLPPWDFLNDLLTEVARRTDDPAAPQRRTELFTAYRSVLIDTGATTRGSDQNSLLLRLLDGEEDLHRLAAELAEVRGRENRLRLDLEEETRRAQTLPGTGTASRERRHRLEEEARALAEHRGELVRRRGVLVTELDDSRRRLAVMEAAGSSGDLVPVGTGTGAGAHQASAPPLPPGPPTSFAEPSSASGRGRRPLVLIAAAAAVVCLAGGGVVVGIWAAGTDDTDNRATPPVSATPRTTPTTSPATPSSATPSALATSAAPAPAPERSSWSLIEDLVPMDVYPEGTKRSFTAGALTVNNRDYPATLYAFEAERIWQLGREYKTFTASAGVSDATPSGDVIAFTVQLDDGVAKEFTMSPGDTVKKVSLNISGVFRIKLTVQESFSTQEGYGAWIDPTITK